MADVSASRRVKRWKLINKQAARFLKTKARVIQQIRKDTVAFRVAPAPDSGVTAIQAEASQTKVDPALVPSGTKARDGASMTAHWVGRARSHRRCGRDVRIQVLV